MKKLILLAAFLLISTPSFAAQVQLPPGTALPSPGATRPPSLQQQQMWREPGGPPTLPPGPPLIMTPQNPFLLPASPKEIQCTREKGADFTDCKIY